MISTPVAIAAAAFVIGMTLVGLANALEQSDRLIAGAQAMLDDEADQPFSEPHETHVREAIAVGNDEPDPDFVTRTRHLVVDELAQRRNQAGAR